MSAMNRALALVALLALVLAACAEDDAADVADDPAPAEEDAEPEDPADEEPVEDEPADDPVDEEPADEEADVAVGSTDLGDVLVDGEGMTLYLFDPDEQGASTCYDDCAESWPPLTTEDDPVAGEGADDALLGTTERDDGTMQVTYDDWPLYHWAGDAEPGETNGQAVQDVWWVLGPDGTPVRDAPGEDDEDETEAGGGGGYGSAY